MTDESLAHDYRTSVNAAAEASLAAEPEAQLTVPVKGLLESVAASAGSSLVLVREAQLDGVRPDFAALSSGNPCGWIELKAPTKTVDGTKWRGREAKQWNLLSALDSLIVCNGHQLQLYREGAPVGGPVELPMQAGVEWSSKELSDTLALFVSSRPSTIKRVSELASKLAPLARMLRDRIENLLQSPGDAPMHRGKATWAAHIHNGVDDAGFANDLSQVIAYSMAIAALRGGADVNADKLIELDEARQAIEGTSPVLAAALGPVLGVKGLLDQIRHEVGAIERLASAVDPLAIAKSDDPRGEPWLWFYEDFLHAFDPEARKKAGVYYTPTDVVQHQVRVVEDILQIRFKRKLGFADSSVVTLDPACGSGTYPLAIIDAAAATATKQRGPAGPAQVSGTLARNLISFELMPGPYAVAHLRIGQRIAEIAGQLLPPEVRVYLTDTLDDPSSVPQTLPLWGDADVLAEERRRAQMVKRDEEVMVAIGNPPYDRVSQSSGAGGWVVSPGNGRALFADILEPAQASTKFSHIASLYNLYIYFWRWAIWKTFQAAGDGPAVVSFITAGSWLSGPGFVGLRKLVQELGDEIWICDLGGNNRGPLVEENVFAIETPVAVVTIMRDAMSDREKLPKVMYRKLEGTRREKLARISALGSPIADPDAWQQLELDRTGDAMTPRQGDELWHEMPALTQIFPWQFPGLKAGRTWPIAPSPQTLSRRWRSLVELPTADERAEAYVTASTGRNIHTRVQGLPQLSSLQADADHEQIVRYAYRSFDREWIIRDPRLLALERPALWASLSDQQIFLSTMITTPLGAGPSMTCAIDVPDLHHFRGNYGGKDTIPLYRDAGATQPNVTKGLLEAIGSSLRETDPARTNPQPVEIAAYVYAVMSSPSYSEKFSTALASPGPRMPITTDPALFTEVVEIGKELIWLHTFGERCTSRHRSSIIPRESSIGWTRAVGEIPESMDDVGFDGSTQTLRIGDGEVSGVKEAVWNLEVSGYAVLRRWIAHRTRRGYGRAATSAKPLDKIRPESWEDDWNDELLDLINILDRSLEIWATMTQLLERICDSKTLRASDLPAPSALEKKEPRV